MTNDDRDRLIMEIHALLTQMTGRVDEHHRTLYGNGRPGLVAESSATRQRQEECPARAAAQSAARLLRYQTMNAMAALAVSAIAVGVTVYLACIRA